MFPSIFLSLSAASQRCILFSESENHVTTMVAMAVPYLWSLDSNTGPLDHYSQYLLLTETSRFTSDLSVAHRKEKKI